jgi:cytochrome c553
MLRSLLCAFVATMLALAPTAQGAEDAAIKTKVEPCFSCHGESGVSTLEGVPSLAGEPELFLEWQLVFFRTGRIKSEIMQPLAAALSDDDVRTLGAYIATLAPLKSAPPPDDAPELTATGRQLATAQHCGNCHGDGFQGNQAAARLAGQREEVLLKALHDYKSGARVGTGVAAMPEVAFPLDDEQMKALAHFMSRQR